MCLTPLHINTKHSRYFSRCRAFMTEAIVPCGHCEQCTLHNKSDLELRSLAEYYDCVGSGGIVLFLTFTYNEECVPYYRYYLDSDGFIKFESVSRFEQDSHTLMTFNKRHFQNYLKSVRSDIDYNYDLVGQLRFLVTSEFGSKSTQRPHYHSLFFIGRDLLYALTGKFVIDNTDFVSCQVLLDYFSKFWPHGMVSASSDGLIVNSDKCISYVSKYVSKTSELLNYSRFQDFFDYICEHFDDLSTPDDSRSRFASPTAFFNYYCRLYGCTFFNNKSINFGLSMADGLRQLPPFELVDRLSRGIPRTHFGKTTYKRYPRYIVRKLFYNNRSDGTFYLNDLGMKTLDYLRLNSIESQVRFVRDFDFSLLDRTPVSVLSSDPYIPSDLVYKSSRDLLDLFRLIPEPIITYGLLLRGRFFPQDSFPIVYDMFDNYFHGTLTLYDFVSHISEYIDKQSDEYDEFALPEGSITLSDYLDDFPNYSFCSFCSDRDSKFITFNRILDLWSRFTSYHRSCVLKYFKQQNDATKLAKDLLLFNKY